MPELILNYLLLCIVCYLIGSIPFASIIVKNRHKKDITQHGTGNVGAMNSFEITGSKSTGVLVFLADFLKGLIPTVVILIFLKIPIEFSVLPLVFLIVGHCFSIFLKFKGGRGLATAAGIFLIVSYMIVILWSVIYFITYKIKKDIHIGNIVATFLLPIPVLFFANFFVNNSFVDLNEIIHSEHKEFLFILTSSVCLIILIKHIQPLTEILKNKNIIKYK
ncbi:MAG TPA: glycerol-3-phosphate acyltransferase [Ignavibacteria bacterium]|nr:glycerol-3-phosphate acyltransferase [Ignavibacteria bacterium]